MGKLRLGPFWDVPHLEFTTKLWLPALAIGPKCFRPGTLLQVFKLTQEDVWCYWGIQKLKLVTEAQGGCPSCPRLHRYSSLQLDVGFMSRFSLLRTQKLRAKAVWTADLAQWLLGKVSHFCGTDHISLYPINISPRIRETHFPKGFSLALMPSK